jgi:amino-acid N-acetyltransferase
MISIRHAQFHDRQAIRDFVRSERLRPTGLHWQRFTVAHDPEGGMAGAIQIRHHADGSRELSSFAVRPDLRGRGVGSGLVAQALARDPGPLYLVTREQLTDYFQRWDFTALAPSAAPRALRCSHQMGRLARVVSWWRGRKPHHLVILVRPG